VLLLRAQGIPARYVTGYALQEYSNWEHAYIVRLSHAHAWVQAYVNGRWVEVDTTPSTWAAEEEKHASVLQPVWDAISYVAFRLSQGIQQVGLRSYAGLALVIAVSAALYGWVRFRRRAVPRSGSKKATGLAGKAARTSPSLTEFGALEREWEARGWARRPHETPRAWLNRVSTQGAGAHTAEQLSRLATVVNALYLSSYGKSTMHNDQDLRP
jgi:transglutaminase-like putative cysteine protease